MNRIQAVLLVLSAILPMQALGQPEWQAQQSPVQDDLVSVSFADTLNGWAVTASGTVIHTADGGQLWQVQQTLDRYLPEKIFFQDPQTGWLTGLDTVSWGLVGPDTTTLLKTTDGGATWDTSYLRTDARFFDIFFINDTMGWVVGFEGDTLGLTLYTTDGGETWTEGGGIYVEGIYTSVHFRDTEEGDICGPGPVMMHTNKGGRGTSPWALELTNLKKPMYDLVNVGELYGCMVGADGKLFFTKDQWNNLIEEDYPEGDTLWSVDAIEPLGFWIAGEAGTILFVGYNEFLGLTLDDQSLDIPQDLFEVDAIDDGHAWAVGEEGTILFFGLGASGIRAPGADALEIFPNPASGRVRISGFGKDVSRIELYSMDGKLRSSSVIPAGTSTLLLELGNLEAGSYVVKAGEDRKVLILLKQ